MGTYSSFEDLEVYKTTIKFTAKVYDLLKKSPLKEDFAMVDQVKRATISISNNISEGFERETDKELIRFLYFSKGSAGEVRNLFNLMEEIGYFKAVELVDRKNQVIDISKQFVNYIKYVKKRSGL
ncbi:four helix bundle protein [Flagellimonas taeanensis]|uniref:Four helix bundle protein n=1 Tax=Flagellimonas taeanensis TaxID=1005926 RepID=A0A1M6QL14_9FLAO|nr:four helix bundle protein [Allomuricauda taeanensis]SFB71368.1 four helix bundle protein [Allomuricauda taeanensis]SHK20743.1 four helix bundle protein [Allomuricauda taeanensis]